MADVDGTAAARRTISTTTSTAARTPLRTQALQNRRRRQLTRSHAVVSFDSSTCYSATSLAPSPLLDRRRRRRRYYRPADTPPQARRADTMVLLRTDTHRHIRVVRQENQAKSTLNASQVQYHFVITLTTPPHVIN